MTTPESIFNTPRPLRGRLPSITLPARPEGLQQERARVANPVFAFQRGDTGVTITLFDEIGAYGVSAQKFANALKDAGREPITLQINSPGGDVFDGVTIYNLLRDHPAAVAVEILGIAASAASIVAMAGESIQIARNAQVMVHRAWMLAIGNAADMMKAADILRETDHALARTYAARTGQPLDRIAEIMADETYLAAERAVELGFADGVLDRDAEPDLTQQRALARTQQDVERDLRRVGYAKTAAQRIAAGGWGALTGRDSSTLARRAAATLADLQAARRSQ